MSVIAISGLSVALGTGPQALDGLSMEVRRGEILLVEGPSGSGKSTLLRVLAGLVPQFHGGRVSGRVRVAGADPLRARPGAMARLAALAFQDPEAQAVMATVARDVAFGPECLGHPREGIAGTVDWALGQASARGLAGRAIASLSSGERQRAALAAVLAQHAPVLLLDEPTSQLDAAASGHLLAGLRRLVDDTGVTVVLAEHRADRARPVADRTVRLPGAADEPAPAAAAPPAPGPTLAALADVTAGRGAAPVVHGAELELRAGVVTALTGANGSGKTTLLRVLAGLDAPAGGRVMLSGRDVTAVPAEGRVPRVGLVPQDPGRHLLTDRVEAELEVGLRALGIPAAERAGRVAASMRELDLEHLAGRHPLDLSAGERERVAIGAALALRPAVLALDEPTRGMDPAARDRLGGLLRRLAADGTAVVVATHDPHLVATACDRVLVLRGGRLGAAAGAGAVG